MPHFWSQNALITMTSWFTRFGPEALLNKSTNCHVTTKNLELARWSRFLDILAEREI